MSDFKTFIMKPENNYVGIMVKFEQSGYTNVKYSIMGEKTGLIHEEIMPIFQAFGKVAFLKEKGWA